MFCFLAKLKFFDLSIKVVQQEYEMVCLNFAIFFFKYNKNLIKRAILRPGRNHINRSHLIILFFLIKMILRLTKTNKPVIIFILTSLFPFRSLLLF